MSEHGSWHADRQAETEKRKERNDKADQGEDKARQDRWHENYVSGLIHMAEKKIAEAGQGGPGAASEAMHEAATLLRSAGDSAGAKGVTDRQARSHGTLSSALQRLGDRDGRAAPADADIGGPKRERAAPETPDAQPTRPERAEQTAPANADTRGDMMREAAARLRGADDGARTGGATDAPQPSRDAPSRPDAVQGNRDLPAEHQADRSATRLGAGSGGTQPPEDPTTADAAETPVANRDDRSARYQDGLNARERFERQSIWSPDRGVAFAFGEARPAPGEVDRWLGGLGDDLRAALGDARTEVTIHASASRPGTEANNLSLTEQRVEALTRELRERGVRAEIRGDALGESLARRLSPPSMALDREPDQEPDDKRDDARFRIALIEVAPHAGRVSAEPERVEGRRGGDAERVAADVARGEQVFDAALAALGERVRSLHALPENPLAPDPSADPRELAGQAWDVGKDAARQPFSTLAKFIAGGFHEIAREQWRQEVAAARRPLYEAIAEGVAAGLDPQYRRPDRHGAPQALADQAERIVGGLSDTQKDELATYLIDNQRTARLDAYQEEPSTEYILDRLDGTSLKWATVHRFADRHFERE